MLEGLLSAVYGMSVSALIISMLLVLVLSAILHLTLKPTVKQVVGIILTVCVLLLLSYVTMLGRSEPETGLLLIPGNSIAKAFVSDIYLKMVLMNIFVFVPYGAFMTLVFSRYGVKATVLVTLLSGLVITVLIEVLQYVLGLGCAETDDVICNLAGAAIGLVPYFATYKAVKKRLSR
ncbi:MAG: VanZ family protein [Lachnospiraceae bacterium]|nr:VanZ family protein [Lachnospiraceae bacterium]